MAFRAFKFNWINEFLFNIQRGVSARYKIETPSGFNEQIDPDVFEDVKGY